MVYEYLAKRMKKRSFVETRISIASKLSRGTFASTFFLGALAAMEMKGVRLENV
jgi:hypothetical protein